MSNGPHIDSRIDAYLAGSPSVDPFEIEAHAAECPACARLLEAHTRLPVEQLPREIVPDPAVRAAVMAGIGSRSSSRARRWLMPVAIAAGLIVAFGVLRPPVKNAEPVPGAAVTEAIAMERFGTQLELLDNALKEIRSALETAPDDPDLLAAIERLEDQRTALTNLMKEFTS
jgi:hypothetical protein